MDKRHVLFLALITMLVLSGCHFKAKKAKQYHDDMLHTVQAVIDSSLDYGDAVQSYEKSRALQAQEKYSSQVNNAIAKAELLKDFDGDTSLQHYSLEMLSFYKTTLDKNFKPFLTGIAAESFSDQERQTADSLYQNLTMTENKYWARFDWAEKKFYKEHEIGSVEK